MNGHSAMGVRFFMNVSFITIIFMTLVFMSSSFYDYRNMKAKIIIFRDVATEVVYLPTTLNIQLPLSGNVFSSI